MLGPEMGVTYNGGVPGRETAVEKRERALEVMDRLQASMPEARIEVVAGFQK